ncbi:MAG: VCBS repeat-containing protein [Bacteroidetes bacterium]|nr:VCBS repeat-containing protein [Bacteroidota bacterium]MBS1540506.1 VCBS repeat-containing protein [Bacteroidota bacterium]
MIHTPFSFVKKNTGLFIFYLLMALAARAQVVSNFSSGADGWTAPSASGGGVLNYMSTGGNPGGYISATGYNIVGMAVVPVYFYFVAPAKFLGNVSSLYNHTITFDLQQGTAQTLVSLADVILSDGTTTLYYYSLPGQPATSPGWASFSVTVNELSGNWKTSNSSTGAAATKNQIKTVLLNLTSFQIRGRYGAAITTGSIDNVVMNTLSPPSPPTITSFSPSSGLPGTPVTLTGTNFNTTASQNIVYFNGSKASVVSATATQLIVTSPSKISYGAITVTNTATGTQGVSPGNFNPLFDNNKDFGGRVIASSFGKYVAFGPPPVYSPWMTGLSIGDLDGDGWQDILTSSNDTGSKYAQVYRNAQQTGGISAASFAAPLTLTLPNSPTSGAVLRVGQTAIADMDSDGKLDVIVNVGYNLGGNDDNSFIIFLNQSTPGTLAFASPYIFQVPVAVNNNQAIAVADMDGDGRPELFLSLQNSASPLGIMQNLSTPGNLDFAYPINVAQGQTFGVDISLGDLNGDNKPEVILEAYLGSAVYAYENTSTVGNISLGVPFQISTATTDKIKVLDLDGDGKNDMLFRDYYNVRIKKNNHTTGPLSAADFAPDILMNQQITSGISSYPYVEAADVNGDNKPDLLTGDGTNMAVYQNNFTSGAISASSFYAGTTFEGSGNSNQYILAADIDGDNKPEILIRPNTGAMFWVYHNESYPVPQVNSVSPASGNVGSSVTLTGSLMNTANATASVRLAKTLASSATVSNTTVTATTPLGAKSGAFSVTEHGLTSSKPFTLLFTTNRIINASSFGPSIDFALGSNVRDALEVADFDDDGRTDVTVIDNFGTGKIFQNTATVGQPITATSLTQTATTYTAIYNVVAFDIDGDGKTDLNNGNLLQNTSGSGSISFSTVSTAAVCSPAVTKGDFNKDGKIDLALVGGASVQVYENLSRTGAFTPTGTFQNFGGGAINIPVAAQPTGMIAADFDGDGFDDLVTVHATTNNATYNLNTKSMGPITTSSFTSLGNFNTTGSQPYDITANDFDGDGKIDIAITYFNSAFVSVQLNTSTLGNISFANTDVPVANSGYKITSQDLDGDGKAEIVIIHRPGVGYGSFTVLQNKCTSGTVSFTATNFPLARYVQALNIADINSDQKPDILIVGTGGATTPTNALMVFQNNIAVVSITINTQPANAAVCSGTTTQFTSAASGTTNIVYQWQYSADGIAAYADLTNTGGYSNVGTATLSVNTTGNFGAGFYRCRVNGDFAAQVISNVAQLTVNSVPGAPITTGSSNCGSGSMILSASGGTNGNYIWYDPTNTVIAGQVNSTYTTPVLTASATYSVAITNGSCTSAKVTAAATINTAPAAPTTTGASGCTNSSVTLTASGGTNGNYIWYDPTNTVIAGQVNATYTTPVLAASATYSVAITNGTCTSAKATVTAAISSGNCPPPVITSQPLDTNIGGMITLNLVPLISTPGSTLDLTTLQIASPPSSGATATISPSGVLTINYNGISFSGTENISIKACDTNGNCTTQQFSIEVAGDVVVFNGISPNGNNPVFFLEYINIIPDTKVNTVQIFDRWENLVWHGANYDNTSVVFKGVGDNGADLPSGVYFYRIDFAGGKNSKTGFISLKRQ